MLIISPVDVLNVQRVAHERFTSAVTAMKGTADVTSKHATPGLSF